MEKKEEAIVSHEIHEENTKEQKKTKKTQNALRKSSRPLPVRILDIWGVFHSTGYSGLRLRGSMSRME